VEQLELLGESLFDFNSLEDLNSWLDNLFWGFSVRLWFVLIILLSMLFL
jgi:hypothetical protein